MENFEPSQLEITGCLVFSKPDQEDQECVNYYPGMLADIEEELGATRDRAFEEAFFCECGC
ncbi:MAG: hypothetical protein NTY51_15735 [Deltaproteobacteria bacterium]|nr:hypothetical protein [Deltaproteobacteria bacterium]